MKFSSFPSLLAALALAPGALAQEPAPTPPAPPAAPPAKERPPKLNLLSYKPPKTAGTVERKDGDGASRDKITLPDGSVIILPDLYVLTPKSGEALTMQAQPSLFTYQTGKAPVEFRVTITEPKQPKPLFVYAASRSAAGLHRVDLAAFDITLKPGVQYEWSVVLRPDPDNRSKDLAANGTIKRVEPEPALVEKIKAAAPWELPGIYAEAGFWYDALAALSDQIAANPKDTEFVSLRAELLKQVKLEEAAKR